MENQKTKYYQKFIDSYCRENITSYQKDKKKYDIWCEKKDLIIRSSHSNLFQIKMFKI